MRITYDASRRVRVGVALLDAAEPGWAERVCLESLNLGDSNECVLGQVFIGYSNGITALSLCFGGSESAGFITKTWPRTFLCAWEYFLLERAWIREIKSRQKKVLKAA